MNILIITIGLFLNIFIPHTRKVKFNQIDTILRYDVLKKYIDYFNSIDTILPNDIPSYISNEKAYEWLAKNIPIFVCPDSNIEEKYYYRWWTFRKHLVLSPEGFIFTEFITKVSHAGKYNTISCAVGHHIYEGRWLHNQNYLDEYILYWLIHDPYQQHPVLHKYSNWIADAIYNKFLVDQDTSFIIPLLRYLDEDYEQWEKEKMLPNEMFWQYDVRDGMEESISGSRYDKNIRPTINSYMYGNAIAIAKMASIAKIDSLRNKYFRKAYELKELIQNNLWNQKDNFFEVRLAKGNYNSFSNVREEIGYIPWYFNLPDDKIEFGKAWEQLNDQKGFKSKWGITTAEQRNPNFRTHGTGHCEWDGAIWPFATTQTLKALANLLTNYHEHGMKKEDYFQLLKQYAESMQKNGHPYIGEYQDEKTGNWLTGDNPRSRYYNHSGFCDLIISDLIGLKPRQDDILEINPLIPDNKWNWFGLDNILYHNHYLTILWDKNGDKFNKGKGFLIFEDGKLIIHSNKLKHIYGKL